MRAGIGYTEWLERQAEHEYRTTGSISIALVNEMQHAGLDASAVERRIKQSIITQE